MREVACCLVHYHMNALSGDDRCESFPFIISIENCNVQYYSSYTGSIAIYSSEISRA